MCVFPWIGVSAPLQAQEEAGFVSVRFRRVRVQLQIKLAGLG
jgi:hypothetical protein